MIIQDKPLHADGLSTTQLLLPGLIELSNDFLSFLLVKSRPFSKNCAHSNWTRFHFYFSDVLIPTHFISTHKHTTSHFQTLHFEQFHHHPSYLKPLNGLFAGWTEDAIMEVADGPGTTGQGRERGWGAHSRHGVGHCGEITPLIDSLAIIHKVFVIAQVCQRERRCMEESKEARKDRRKEGRSRRQVIK